MVNKECYSVLCESLESCAPKKNKNGNMDTLVAYVARKFTPKCKLIFAEIFALNFNWFDLLKKEWIYEQMN